MSGRLRASAEDEERAREAVRSILPSQFDDDEADGDVAPGGVDVKQAYEEETSYADGAVKQEHSPGHGVDGGDSLMHCESEASPEELPPDTKDFERPQFYQDSDRENGHSKPKSPPRGNESVEVKVESAQSTLCDVVAAHYNSVPESGLDERSKSRILHLRNFNNWIKSMLIDEYVNKVRDSKPRGSSLKVLDMGCGKGGDLFKWRQGKITHLVCADIAATSIEQCKDRYSDIKQRAQRERNFSPLFSAEFIVANCTKERLRDHYQDVTMQLDLVSCQFAFHYCFESLPQAECMMRNASECLRPGGYFFGSCPNANAIVSRARKAGGKKFGNDVYFVEFETPINDIKPPPIFGAKYNFHMEGVVDCPEFLVHFPTFIRLAEKYNLEFVACEPFNAFFDRKKVEGRGLLGRMQAFETYPPFPGQSMNGPLSQYQHGDAYLKSQTNAQRLGTLSVAEWEATTLYLIFVFQKASS
ncbi:hypothetical protein ONE63_002746 [Megalurothrips usitatus]|uniref:mRNA cap guanine-N(7) methyltransferase n=1 Tax=Megalurothrips usitatus TaxID=439358 RepID=A0AAV7X546_9NEOP|nr:hypothetical protein ONE63_002746 [Megalurothrips usitatus]KAJ1521035.1 hypothetical protein ONE63_002746 [Megalurothrips usitatus]